MALINWEEDYKVGVRELDDQHKKMFNLINGFYEAMKNGKGEDELGKLLGELTDYAGCHLAAEEKYFREYGYPDQARHIKSHDGYREKIMGFSVRKKDPALYFDVLDFLEDWWLGHITTMDRQYKDFFRTKGLN